MFGRKTGCALFALSLGLSAIPALAETPGITDTEIKIGQNAAFSGPASVYGQISTAESHYFKMINDQGGINGRKINLIALDDAYSPPKAVEVIRRLVEDEQVAILFQTLGTASNVAIRKYVNQKKVPDIWIGSGASVFSASSKDYPLDHSVPTELSSGRADVCKIYSEEQTRCQNWYPVPERRPRSGLCRGSEGRPGRQVRQDGRQEYFIRNYRSHHRFPDLDLKSSGADVFYDASTPKFSAMSIRKTADIDWHPLHIIDSNGALVRPALESAGFDKSVGVMTAQYLKDPTDPGWADDPGMKEFLAWKVKYAPEADIANPVWYYGYTMAQALVVVLKQAGNDLSRENIMKAATHLPDTTTLPLVLPGIKISTSPTDYQAMKGMRLVQFDGKMFRLVPD